MRKIFGLLIISLFTASTQAQSLDLKDITSGKYYPRGVRSVVSSADGESYYQSDEKNKLIIKYSYKTGQATDTVFNVNKARECTFDSFQGFIMSPDENVCWFSMTTNQSIVTHSKQIIFITIFAEI